MLRPIAAALLAILTISLSAQSPSPEYTAAHKRFLAHTTEDGFALDNSPEAIAAADDLWTATAHYIADLRGRNPKISVASISHDLCLLTAEPLPPEAIQQTPEQQCETEDHTVVELSPNLLLVAPSDGEIGTVFLLNVAAKPARIVWSIANTPPSAIDPNHLVGAWKTRQAQDRCRDLPSPHQSGDCGPLFGDVGVLPPDGQHRPRFYVDGEYAQPMGATVGKQTSIWRWDGDHATLLWITQYPFMIDQPQGITFDEDLGELVIGQKGYFRSSFDCGSCIDRPLEQRVLLSNNGVEDLGTRSLVPELDLIDTLYWKLAHNQTTAAIASPQVAQLLKSKVLASLAKSEKITPDWFTIGMVESHLVKLTPTGAQVCFGSDDFGSIDFTLRRTPDGGYFITSAKPRQTGCPTPVPFTPTP